jgi:phosphatidylserine decarboxylase
MPEGGVAAHQYVDRSSDAVVDERLYADQVVRFLYGPARERAPALFAALTGARMSSLLGFLNYDSWIGARLSGNRAFSARCGLDLSECADPPESLRSARARFERKIRYWECRPMPADPAAVVSPADARALVGSLRETGALPVKEKFFRPDELFLDRGAEWAPRFIDGEYAIFRLTPDKYHWNHTPVAGVVADRFELPGRHHACNPEAVVAIATPHSKNARCVTLIDTDVPGGTGAGLVAMVEVVALMIGRITQAYSEVRYDDPRPVERGTFVRRGCPKSLFQPGSSTVILLFERGRVTFAADLLANRGGRGARSRYTSAFGEPLAETDLRVRSLVGRAAPVNPP